MTAKPLEIKYSYKNVPTLRKFSESKAFFRLALGPFGSGKSTACVVEMVSRALAQKQGPDGIRRSRFIVIRNTYRQLNDSTIRTVHNWLPPHIFGTYKQSDQSYVVKAFEGVEFEILYRALDRPDHVGNLLSVEATSGWVNEAREVPWPIIEALQGRVGRYPAAKDGGCSHYSVWMDSNPGDQDSKMYKYFCEQEHPPGHAELFKQPSGLSSKAENLDNLPGGQKYYTTMAEGKDPEWVKVYCQGDWGYTQEGKPVFSQYLDQVHCVENVKPESFTEIYRGWDFGLTPACVFLQLTSTGQLIVFDEMTSESMSVDQFSDEVLEHSSRKYPDYTFIDIGDPAGEQRAQTDAKTCFQILHSKGINIEAGMQSESIRLESVRRPLTRLVGGKPGFQLHKRCKQLRKGFMGGYCYRRLMTSQERYTDRPDKNQYSHPHDALQYPLTRIFGGGLTTPQFREDRDFRDEEISDQGRSSTTGY